MKDPKALMNQLWPDYVGDSKVCYRCGNELPSFCFTDPVSICIECYRSMPGHQELSLVQLREKAMKSRWGKRKNTEARRKEALRDLAVSYGAGVGTVDLEKVRAAVHSSSLVPESQTPMIKEICERCGKESAYYEARAVDGDIKIICHECIPPRPEKRKR